VSLAWKIVSHQPVWSGTKCRRNTTPLLSKWLWRSPSCLHGP